MRKMSKYIAVLMAFVLFLQSVTVVCAEEQNTDVGSSEYMSLLEVDWEQEQEEIIIGSEGKGDEIVGEISETTVDDANVEESDSEKVDLDNVVEVPELDNENQNDEESSLVGEESGDVSIDDVLEKDSAQENVTEELETENSDESDITDDTSIKVDDTVILEDDTSTNLEETQISIYNVSDFTYTTTSSGTIEISGYTGSGGSVEIPETIDGIPVTSIKSSAFQYNSDITSVTIPESITSIGYKAFKDCSNLKNIYILSQYVTFSSNSGVGAFGGCAFGSAGPIGGGYDFEFAWDEKIPKYAFLGADSLESVIVPESITSIEYGAFNDCCNLKGIVIPNNVTSIGTYAFLDCTNMSTVTLGNEITEIGTMAFADCSSLISIVIPENVTSIGYGAFADCLNLKKLQILSKYTTFSSNWTRKTFSGCAFESAGPIGGGYDFEFAWDENIPEYAFQGADSIKSVVIPESIIAIENYAFEDCSSLISIVIPESVTSLKSNTFSNCTALRYAQIPQSTTDIATTTFNNTPNLTIYCSLNSMATIYAVDNEIPLITSLGTETYIDDSLDRSCSNFFVNSSAALCNGYVQVSIDTAINDQKWDSITSTEILLRVPTGIEIMESTIKINNILCTDYELEDNILTIPTSTQETNITLYLTVKEQSNFYSYALLKYNENGSSGKDVVGVVLDNIDAFTLNIEERTASTTVHVQGIAPANTEITIFSNGIEKGRVYSNLVDNS